MTSDPHTVARELGSLLKDLSHPDRISIVQLLATHGACTVGEIAGALQLTSTRASQHLAVLRASRLVSEQPDGRRRIYRVASPRIAAWLANGVEFVAHNLAPVNTKQVDSVRRSWLGAIGSAARQRVQGSAGTSLEHA
jgi:DNA-binding transcriptional ArsR family regulator